MTVKIKGPLDSREGRQFFRDWGVNVDKLGLPYWHHNQGQDRRYKDFQGLRVSQVSIGEERIGIRITGTYLTQAALSGERYSRGMNSGLQSPGEIRSHKLDMTLDLDHGTIRIDHPKAPYGEKTEAEMAA